jgi:hypothetical protein
MICPAKYLLLRKAGNHNSIELLHDLDPPIISNNKQQVIYLVK